jgi:hypothetical protein
MVSSSFGCTSNYPNFDEQKLNLDHLSDDEIEDFYIQNDGREGELFLGVN